MKNGLRLNSGIVLLSIIIFYVVNNYIWLRLSSPFPTFFYYAFDFNRVIELYNQLVYLKTPAVKVIETLFNVHDAYLYSLSAALIAVIFGKNLLAIILFNNLPYFAIAIFSIYMIGRKITDNSTGLWAAVIFSLYPAVYGTSRLYVLEFAVMGMAALCILCLLNTEEFANRKYSLLFGLFFGWGMLIKYSLAAFIIGPLVYVLYKTIIAPVGKASDKNRMLSYRIFNIALAVLVATAIMGIKYFNFNNVRSYLLRPLYQANITGPWYIFNNLRIYTLGIFERQLSFFYFLLLIFGLCGFFVKTKIKIVCIILSWIIIPWLILLTMPHFKMTHFIIPYLPAMALISAIGFKNILRNSKKIRFILGALILIIGVIQYYDFSFGVGFNLSSLKIGIKNAPGKEDTSIYYYFLSKDVCDRPKNDEVYNKGISLITERSGKNSDIKVLILPLVNSYTDVHIWRCVRWFKGFPFKAVILEENEDFIGSGIEALKEADFILYSGYIDIKDKVYLEEVLKTWKRIFVLHFNKDGLRRINIFLEHNLNEFRTEFQKLVNNFELLEKVTNEQGETLVYLYGRKSDILSDNKPKSECSLYELSDIDKKF